MQSKLVIGTRGSPLALTQTKLFQASVVALLPDWTIDLQIIKTTGDAWALQNQSPLPPGKGIFTKELEEALYQNKIDLAVHSLKDLPVENPKGLSLALYPPRESPWDLLITRGEKTIQELPPRALVATGSPRRKIQLLLVRPDLQIIDIRGNIDTRLRKFRENPNWSALILAEAGVHRLRPDLSGLMHQPIPASQMLPAPGQGALGIQMRENDPRIPALLPLHCGVTAASVLAERSYLQALGGGCAQPIAAFASIQEDQLHLEGFWSDGEKNHCRHSIQGGAQNAHACGVELAQKVSF